MECISKNCKISGVERMVSCWLCLGGCHLKCSGLKVRDADALDDKLKYLQWTCPNCRIIGVEFYNFFKRYKAEFIAIQNDFVELKYKFDKYSELFSKFTNLDNFSPLPKRKRKGSAKQSSSSPGISKLSDESKNLTNSNSIVDSEAVSQVIPASNLSTTQTSLPPQPQLNIAASSNPDRQIINYSPELMVFSPVPPSESDVIENCQTILQGNKSVTSTAIKPKPLRVIPPMKAIFATRLAPDTTVLDVETYIKNNIEQSLSKNIKIYKISASNRASFKIIVPEASFGHLVNPNFWPKDTFVRQFVYRSNDNVILPSATESISKN